MDTASSSRKAEKLKAKNQEYVASDDILKTRLNSAIETTHQLEREVRSLKLDLERTSIFEDLLNTGALSDITIVTGRDNAIFEVHKVMICLESEFFRKCCSPPWKEGSEGTITLEDIYEDDLRIILEYCYRGLRLPTRDSSISQLKRLFEAADFLIMPTMKEQIALKVIKTAKNSMENGDFEMGKVCMKFVMENYEYYKTEAFMKQEQGDNSWRDEVEGLIRQVGLEGMYELIYDSEIRTFMEENGGFGIWLWEIFLSTALGK